MNIIGRFIFGTNEIPTDQIHPLIKIRTPPPLTCSYCHGTDFVQGKDGGINISTMHCANDECRHWFSNVDGVLHDSHKTEPVPPYRLQQDLQRRRRGQSYRQKFYEEGYESYIQGKSLNQILTTANNEYEFYATKGEDLIKFAGWIDAFRDSLARKEQEG